MRLQLVLQDGSGEEPRYILDAISAAAEGMNSAIGVFAFATVAGIDLLFSLKSIRRLASRGQLLLLAGIDAITNREALLRLSDLTAEFRGLTARVFLNDGDGIFHPKLCRFSGDGIERWVIGSGNLTPRGLRDSYEASVVIDGSSRECRELAQRLDAFLERHAEEISDIGESALARADQNRSTDPVSKVEPSNTLRALVTSGRQRVTSSKTRTGSRRGAQILIAELPKGGARWNQANFDYSTARGFFGVDPDRIEEQQDLFLTEVLPDGLSEREEIRRFTFTRSHNLRIQLAAKSGLAYPSRGRPIVVIRKLKPRHLAYHLLFPDEAGYEACSNILGDHAITKVRRVTVPLNRFQRAWPQSLLAKLE